MTRIWRKTYSESMYLPNVINVSSTNSKQCKLCVNSSRNIDTRLLRETAICCNCTQTIKLSKVLCLECSTCAIFLSSSFTVSIMARFLRSSLSESDINAPFILLFNLVISCMPSTNNLLKRFLLIYPLSPTSFP